MSDPIELPVFQPRGFRDFDHTDSYECLVNRETAARFLGKPTSWLRYCERHGKVPYYKVGSGSIRYRLSELDAWLKQCCRVAPTTPLPGGSPEHPACSLERVVWPDL